MTDGDPDVDVAAEDEVLEELAATIADVRDHMWCGEVEEAKRKLENTPETGCPICEEFVSALQGGLLFALSGHPGHREERLDQVGDEAHRIYKLLEEVLEEEAPA